MIIVVTQIGRKPITHKVTDEVVTTSQAKAYADQIQEILANFKTLDVEMNGHSVIYRTDQIQNVEVRP